MNPTDALKKEHRDIELMMSILERMCRKLRAKEPLDVNHLEQVIGFLKGFADNCHHMKEENLLFPALENMGIPREGGPIGVMLNEHAVGREYISTMTDTVLAMRNGNPDASPKFVAAARGYIDLLTEHIAKEDNVLFPMADAHLAADVQSNLLKEFERVEREEIGTGRHEAYHETMKQLKGIYLA